MKSFDDLDVLIGAVPHTIVGNLRVIDTGRGTEDLHRQQLPDLLTSLADRARVESIEASSAIEGVVVENRARARAIVEGGATQLRNRDEQQLAGYRAALDHLYQEQWRPLNVGLVLHLHRLLFQFTQTPGGAFKTEANLVVDRLPDGTKIKRFTPVSVQQTPLYVEELIVRYRDAHDAGRHHPVLVAGLFVLDLLTIHPFIDGNGRVARVLTNALLEDAGYAVSRYVSLETAIARSADAYSAALAESTAGWHEGEHTPWPWLRYFTAVVAGAYTTFAQRTAEARTAGNKQDRVRLFILEHAPQRFRTATVRAALPGVSDPTIRLVLNALRDEGLISSDGSGRGATWVRR